MRNTMNLTALRDYLNQNFKKRNGNLFSISDTQGYISRGKLPAYLGASKIILNENVKGIKTYFLENNGKVKN